MNEPASGYLWNAAARAGITFRDYGEFTNPDTTPPGTAKSPVYKPNKKVLAGHVDPAYPNFDTGIQDQYRVDRWLEEFRGFERTGDDAGAHHDVAPERPHVGAARRGCRRRAPPSPTTISRSGGSWTRCRIRSSGRAP